MCPAGNQRGQPFGVPRQQVEADDATHRRTPEGRPGDVECVEYGHDIADLTVDPVAVHVMGRIAAAVTTGIDENEAMAFRERVDVAGGPPSRAIPEEAVQQHQWRSAAHHLERDPNSVVTGDPHRQSPCDGTGVAWW
ncbi:hypothetical protein GCM10017687_29710 [Streptomyces echinatus]